MGLCISPNACQATIEEILEGLELTCYIDYIGHWSDGTYEEHMAYINNILKGVEGEKLNMNALKCEWAMECTNFIGYDMTPTE